MAFNLHKIADLIEAGILAIGDGYRAKNSELADHGIPFARAGNIDGGFQFKDADRFPKKDLKKVGEKLSQPGDVVFTSKGTVGRFAFVTEETEQFVFSPQLSYWRSLNQKIINPRFLFYWMQSKEFRDQANSVKGQTDMADYVSLTDQRRMKIILPDICLQTRIAEILGNLDDKIELNYRMNRTLDELAAAIFKSWFVNFEPVVAQSEGPKPFGISEDFINLLPSKFLETENDTFPNIPSGWRLSSLDKIAHYENGLALQKYRPTEDEYLPVIKIRELRQGFADVNSEKASPRIKQSCIINDGDMVFSWSGSLLMDLWCGGKGALNQHLFKVTSNKYPKWFYFYWTNYHLVDFQDIAEGKATTMGHIQRHHLTSATVVLPPDPVIKLADMVLKPLIDRIIGNRIQNRTLIDLRNLLLPRLLSGEIRLKQQNNMTESI